MKDGRDPSWEVSFKPWYVYSQDTENNPGIEKYMAHLELAGDYAWGSQKSHRNMISGRLRNNLRRSGNRGALELTYSRGIGKGWRLFAQYFNGYGESLLDYNDSSNRISFGIVLSRAR